VRDLPYRFQRLWRFLDLWRRRLRHDQHFAPSSPSHNVRRRRQHILHRFNVLDRWNVVHVQPRKQPQPSRWPSQS
jgi:hypothetical protein